MEIKATVNSLNSALKILQERVEVIESTVEGLTDSLLRHDSELEKIKINLKNQNLIIVGLDESVDETEDLLVQKLNNFITSTLETDPVNIDTAFRFGAKCEGKPRNVNVKFCRESHRNAVFNARHTLFRKKLRIYINEDLPPETRTRRHQLRIECHKAVNLGKNARLVGDKLIIDNVVHVLSQDGKLVQYVHTPYLLASASKLPSYLKSRDPVCT